ncbi:KN motif and ankyrin repeat domain-containing protein 4 isoform X2 [Melanotaenia boesemani]|uniref:KN motif and ankyrin repeat domain-containing protein 4 isoform X2 n=1 Tax=Melanotaenia boesemani TaxID=1250792 RepID=UPI001C051246|nr:KN motif and ankyrin repeat domain-containing protein 4 isoform X2 [Melanotaenia boesemani]
MDKKSANGFQTKTSEGGVQRKQLPYSVETPYGFHLDLDFLKYVDDIEKGNTIKRVHIQRRVKGPPKFSTLPRNFSLPGHGVRPSLKEKDSAWSGTSTLGPKPKSRVTEVQQIFDFRGSEGGTPGHSSRGTTSQGTGYVSTKARDEAGAGVRGVEDKTATIQSRPNLLRASSMPITLQQRKGSDSSSPDCAVGTPENGSTENMFRPSPDITERRCLPQDRAGLHQQITVALKRVRELEEQVKTIPELKSQICSLREEREQLLLQLQAQVEAQVSTSPFKETTRSDAGTSGHLQVHRSSEGLNLSQTLQPSGGLGAAECVPEKQVKGAQGGMQGPEVLSTARETSTAQQQTLPSEKLDSQKKTLESPQDEQVQKMSQGIEGKELTLLQVMIQEKETSSGQDHNAAKKGNVEGQDGMQKLQGKLMILEAKLTQASQELDRTNSLLKEQIEENKAKEEKILKLSEGMRVEICSTPSFEQPRRQSIDTGTVTERIDFISQETETESPATVDQGTDTDRICVEVCVPKPRTGSIDQGTLTSKVDTHDQLTEIEAEADMTAGIPPRPRANSMERGTITESIITQDQTTETPVAGRVNQVTETEGETVTNHLQRPRASSVDRGTETERVNTVDSVTETEVAQRADQQTETETERRQDNNPGKATEAESQVNANEDVPTVVSEGEEDNKTNERIQKEITESVAVEVPTVILVTTVEDMVVQTLVSDVSQTDMCSNIVSATGDSQAEVSPAQDESAMKEIKLIKGVEPETVEPKQDDSEATEKKETGEGAIVCASIKETVITETVVETAEDSAVKRAAPVRPQRGRKTSLEQAQPSPQLQAAPVRPHRGSSETQGQQTQKKTQPQAQVKGHSPAKKPPEETSEKRPQAQSQADSQSLSSGGGGVQIRPKSNQVQSQSQTSSFRRDSKELKALQRGSSVSHTTTTRGSGEEKSRPTRQVSSDVQPQSQGSRRSSTETQAPSKDANETQSLQRGSSEAAQRRGSSEAQATRRDSGEAQTSRRGSSESPTSPAALGQVVTRLTGLLGEQWAQLGSSSGTQQMASQQESPTTQKQTTSKRAEAGKGTSTKPAGKSEPAASTVKPAGKPGPSKMSSIQSQLVSSLSVLSAFYSPGQKAAAASKQQEQGLKSIMKKNGVADKQSNKGAKKNLKFVGVNGGYETTSSEESSGDEKSKVEMGEEDSSEQEVEKENDEEPKEAMEAQGADAEAKAEGGGTAAAEKEVERSLLDPEGSQDLLEEQAEGGKVDKGFIDACLYVKDRMEEVSSPDKEMRQVLVVLYQEWFRVSSQKDSQADTVRLYLRQVGLTTPTLLPYVVNLTDGNGNMALHYSVSHSNFPVVKLLLDTGLCETDNVNKAGYTPVMLAALTAAESPDDLEVVQQLLKLGDVNARSRQAGQTALMLAVSHGRVAMVKLLLSCGVDVNAQDREGSTALMCATEHGHTHIASLLLETGRCDTGLIDKNGQTALAVAEAAAHQDIIDLLKAHASEPTSTTDLL